MTFLNHTESTCEHVRLCDLAFNDLERDNVSSVILEHKKIVLA